MYGEGALTEWCVKSCAVDFLLGDAPWVSRPVEVHNDQVETLFENNFPCPTREIVSNILKYPINKVIGENEKCVLLYRKKPYGLCWPIQYPIVVFICISLMTNDVVHISTYLLTIWMSFWGNV